MPGLAHNRPRSSESPAKAAPSATKARSAGSENPIRVKIGRTHVLLGQSSLADRFAADVVDSEAGKIDTTKATLIGADTFDDAIIPVGASLMARIIEKRLSPNR